MPPKKTIIFIFILAIISGVFWNYPIFGQPISSDQGLYDGIAVNILSGKGFTYYGRDPGMEPLYPLFLAGVYGLFGHNYDMVRVIQIFLFALTAVFVYLLAKKLFGHKIALWSSVATGLFYGIANQAGTLTTEMLFIFLFVVFIWAIYNATLENKHKWFIVAGAVLGLAAMTRGIIQYFFIFAVINLFFIYFKKLPIKEIILKLGIFLISFFIVLMPWLIREHSIGGSGMTVAPRAGGGLITRVERMDKIYPDYTGHFIGAFFGYYFSEKLGYQVNYSEFRNLPEISKKITELLKSKKSETEIDKILTAEATEKILKEPHKFIAIAFLDFINFNSPILFQKTNLQDTLTIHPMFAEGRHPEIAEWAKIAIILSIRFIWFLFLGLAVYALAKNIRDWPKISWIFLIIVYFNLAFSAIGAIPRYALPIYPFYILLAVIGIKTLLKKELIGKTI